VVIEACIDSLASARAAEKGGAGRLELCDSLADGGTTPSAGMLATVRDAVTLPVFAIIRPRGGGFAYDDDELTVIRRDIDVIKRHGADGIVVGVLNPGATVDRETLTRLVEEASPLPVTFHRAFDLTRDLGESLEVLIECGVERVLTSGGAPSALEGVESIASLVRQADRRIRIMAGGGLREDHVGAVVARSGVTEIHIRGTRLRSDPMDTRGRRIPLRKALPDDPLAWEETDESRIRRFVELANGAARA
jgi:copper homeostasis protein